MGGLGATGDMDAGMGTYLLLAEGTGPAEGISGKYWASSTLRTPKKEAEDVAVQERLMEQLEDITGVKIPDA
jgi:uncharacterized protein YcfJ